MENEAHGTPEGHSPFSTLHSQLDGLFPLGFSGRNAGLEVALRFRKRLIAEGMYIGMHDFGRMVRHWPAEGQGLPMVPRIDTFALERWLQAETGPIGEGESLRDRLAERYGERAAEIMEEMV